MARQFAALATQKLVMRNGSASGWCHVWPDASCGARGQWAEVSGSRKFGRPSRQTPRQAAQCFA